VLERELDRPQNARWYTILTETNPRASGGANPVFLLVSTDHRRAMVLTGLVLPGVKLNIMRELYQLQAEPGGETPEAINAMLDRWVTADVKSEILERWDKCGKTEGQASMYRPWDGPLKPAKNWDYDFNDSHVLDTETIRLWPEPFLRNHIGEDLISEDNAEKCAAVMDSLQQQYEEGKVPLREVKKAVESFDFPQGIQEHILGRVAPRVFVLG